MDEPELLNQQSSIDDRFKLVTINFKPGVQIADDDTIAIMGEFNNWMPEIMERFDSEQVLLEPELTNTFYYKTKLFRGFRYRYQFNVGDQFVIDQTKEVSEDRTGRMTNSVSVPTKQEE